MDLLLTKVVLLMTMSCCMASILFPKEALPTKSGYLTVNSKTGSAIFYTFYEAQNPYKNNFSETPILVWLQGGPGCSSMLANLFELGPWLVNQDLSLVPNPTSWNRIFGLVFLDNPIGTGFSIAASPQDIPRDQSHVAKHLFIALKAFIHGFDKSRPIYLTGESYAGKYIPAFGSYIIKMNARLPRDSRLNLAGVSIGNGLTDPEVQVQNHALVSYNLGLINQNQMILLEKLQLEAVRFVQNGRWNEAANARTKVLNTLTNMSGLATLYDFRRLTPYPNRVVVKFLNNVEVKKALGVKQSMVFELCSAAVADALHDDIMKSVKPMVEFLINHTRVLLYQGQCDLRDGVVSTSDWVKTMKWEEIGKFLEGERKIWRVDGNLAGYVQIWKNLSNVVVLNAGHLVPTDQPKNSQVMIEDWLLKKGLFAPN